MTESLVLMTVVQPGILSIPVDGGRKGSHKLGLTSGGPLDQHAFYWANRLCHNPPSATCIEITLGGLELRIERPCQVAVTGAEMPVLINGRQHSRWQTLSLNPGDYLQLGEAVSGMRSYLAVSGGFETAKQFGSATAVPREKLGGTHIDGSGLKGNETLVGTEVSVAPLLLCAKENSRVYGDELRLRVILGYQHSSFSAFDKNRLFHTEYRVSEKIDRMGMRLEGAKISSKVEALKSEGISLGAIQIPPDGQPIVMLNDRQTIGGYPKLGAILSLDCDRLAQARPGTRLTFTEIDMFTAHNLLHLACSKRQQTKLSEVS